MLTPQQLGGLAVKDKTFPRACPRCGASMRDKTYHGYLGHLGMHGYADKYFCGNVSAAARQLCFNAMAAYDPAPWNGVWQRRKKSAKTYQAKGNPMKTDFAQIVFDADKHTYTLNGKKLKNVTGFIKEFQKPFDRDGIARRVAEKEKRSVEEILAEWEATAERGRVIGTAVHQHIEATLRGDGNGQLSFDPFLNLNSTIPEVVSFNTLWQQLAPKVSYCKEHIEWVVGDAELGLAGTADMMFFSPDTGKYHLWDWKTGKLDLDNKWEDLLAPFGYLSASKFNIYSIQISLYRLMIERNTGFDLGDSYIVHLTPSGFQVHRAIDLRERLLDYMDVPF